MEPALKCPWPEQHRRHQDADPEHDIEQARTPALWSELRQGDNVILFVTGQGKQPGVVDAVSVDGAVLWVLLSDGGGRRLFLKEEVHKTLVKLQNIALR